MPNIGLLAVYPGNNCYPQGSLLPVVFSQEARRTGTWPELQGGAQSLQPGCARCIPTVWRLHPGRNRRTIYFYIGSESSQCNRVFWHGKQLVMRNGKENKWKRLPPFGVEEAMEDSLNHGVWVQTFAGLGFISPGSTGALKRILHGLDSLKTAEARQRKLLCERSVAYSQGQKISRIRTGC